MVPDALTTDDTVERWAASGAMALTGLPEEPLGPPDGLVAGLDRLGGRFAGLDTLALLGERAAHMGLWRRGPVSCGGSCHLLPSPDCWLAVSLPRDEDGQLVPAWLELDDTPGSEPALWAAVARAVATQPAPALLERGELLGLPVARVGEATGRPGVSRTQLGDGLARSVKDVVVADLSALWAGPLCADLLARQGATVVKVESRARPDGARRGPASFFDLLNGRKRSVALDFTDHRDRRMLHELVRHADVVIEASRPRALAQLGVDVIDIVREGGPQVWVSITGYGRTVSDGRRVAFGDDAAAAGGLVVWADTSGGTRPLFCADAVADPLAGLTAADACLHVLDEGGRWLVDVSMAGVCGALAGPTLPVPARHGAGRAPHAAGGRAGARPGRGHGVGRRGVRPRALKISGTEISSSRCRFRAAPFDALPE